MVFSFFKALWDFRLVLRHLVNQYVSLRYRRTALGFLWTLVNPLLTMAVTAFVFSLMMRMPLKGFAVFLFSGLIPWMLFSGCLVQGGASLIENEALIKKIYIPKQTLVVARCTGLLVDAVLSFACLFLIAIVLGAPISFNLLFLPVAFFLTYVFATGVALMMSLMSVFLRDTQQIVGILLQAGYFLTPIIYPMSIVPPQYHPFMKANPMYYFVDLFRMPIYEARLPSVETLVITALYAAASLMLAILMYRRYENEVIFRL